MKNTIKVVHTQKEKFDVYIGRKSASVPGEFGNPFAINANNSREAVIRQFEEYFLRKPELMMSSLKNLRGKILGCFCAPLACHGDIYKKYVESPYLYNEERQKRGLDFVDELAQYSEPSAQAKAGKEVSVKVMEKEKEKEGSEEKATIEIKKPKPRSFKFKF